MAGAVKLRPAPPSIEPLAQQPTQHGPRPAYQIKIVLAKGNIPECSVTQIPVDCTCLVYFISLVAQLPA